MLCMFGAREDGLRSLCRGGPRSTAKRPRGSSWCPVNCASARDRRKYFPKESIAQGYCNRLKSDLLHYSDKARGLSDAQKIEAQACFERLAAQPDASMTDAVDEYIERLKQARRSVILERLGEEYQETKKAIGGRAARPERCKSIGWCGHGLSGLFPIDSPPKLPSRKSTTGFLVSRTSEPVDRSLCKPAATSGASSTPSSASLASAMYSARGR